MRVSELVNFLLKYPPDTVVLSAGYSAEKDYGGLYTVYEGELNVAIDKNGQPYLTVYEIKLDSAVTD